MKSEKKTFRQRLADKKIRRQLTKSGPRRSEFLRLLLNMLNRYVTVLFIALILYILLLFIMVHYESAAPGANILTIGDAVWYSLTTFTTVGYGDLAPITTVGRLIGSVFLIVSIGLLGFFVGFMVEFIARIRPIIALSLNAGRPWYIFTGVSPYATIFAENLKNVRSDAFIIYADTLKEDKTSKDVHVSWSVKELLDRRGSMYDAHIICMKENEMENFLDSVSLADTAVPIICLASFCPAHHPMNINFFSLTDCSARVFWQQFPIKKEKETIVLIGFGNAGTVMLDRALELNVISKDQRIVYHVFGDGREYCRNRKLLSEMVSVNTEAAQGDSVIFHGTDWNEDEELLCHADRIILCSDSEWDNILILHTIQKFFAIRGELYIYNSNVHGVATSFGQAREMLTPAFVLHNRLSDMALCRHEFFRFGSGFELPLWEDLGSLTKDMNFVAVDHISTKVRIALGNEAPSVPFDELPADVLRKAAAVFNEAAEDRKENFRELEHERMLRCYRLHNYHCSDVHSDDLRTTPLLKPYSELSEKERKLSDIGWALLDELAAHKEAREHHG
ncbi:MAG: ion transporter [Lachnospiraceae bacterium]|nr:ion transporter [Lachnospiraceae bacterium]